MNNDFNSYSEEQKNEWLNSFLIGLFNSSVENQVAFLTLM